MAWDAMDAMHLLANHGGISNGLKREVKQKNLEPNCLHSLPQKSGASRMATQLPLWGGGAPTKTKTMTGTPATTTVLGNARCRRLGPRYRPRLFRQSFPLCHRHCQS